MKLQNNSMKFIEVAKQFNEVHWSCKTIQWSSL